MTSDPSNAAIRVLKRSLAALGLAALTAWTAPAAAEDLPRGTPDLPAWWSSPGRPGWTPDADRSSGFPWTLAGHARGAWRIEEPERAPRLLPYPEAHRAQTPLPWIDSVSVVSEGGAAWAGYSAALATVRSIGGIGGRGPGASIADLTWTNGGDGQEDYSLSLRRRDSLLSVRVEALSWNRGGTGALSLAGRHIYGVGFETRRGDHVVGATFGQRGDAGGLESGEQQTARSQSGSFAYAFDRPGLRLSLEAGRGRDEHESFGGALLFSRREGDATFGAAELMRGGDEGAVAARFEWREEDVRRATDGVAVAGVEGESWWGAVRGMRRWGAGRLTGAVGFGRHELVDRFEVAPRLSYEVVGTGVEARVVVERVLVPVWSDLRAGVAPFLQSTWLGGLEAAAGGPTLHGRAGWRMGRTQDRAVVARLPIEELWLRSGFASDPDFYDFGLLTLDWAWRPKVLDLGGEGFALARDASPLQPQVDPGYGARLWVGARGAFFGGDLRATLRAIADLVGERESEATPSNELPSYVTWGATLGFTLADARISFVARNLEDRARPQTWIDPATGVEALGAGLDFRFELAWRLYN